MGLGNGLKMLFGVYLYIKQLFVFWGFKGLFWSRAEFLLWSSAEFLLDFGVIFIFWGPDGLFSSRYRVPQLFRGVLMLFLLILTFDFDLILGPF